MTEIRREFTTEATRRMGTLKRRWADPEPAPAPVVEAVSAPLDDHGYACAADACDCHPEPAPEPPVVAPTVTYKPDPDPPGRPKPPGAQSPALSGIVINVSPPQVPSLSQIMFDSGLRRQERVRPDNR